MAFIKSIKEKLGLGAGKGEDTENAAPDEIESFEMPASVSAFITAQKAAIQAEPDLEAEQPAEEGRPGERRVIQAPVISAEAEEDGEGDKIKIKAQPSRSDDECRFMVNRPVFSGYSWFFKELDAAQGSPLAEKLFAIDEVETVIIHDTTLTLTRKNKMERNWEQLARQAGAVIREHLQSGSDAISAEIRENIVSEDKLREQIQVAIDTEVNPGVAGHGGEVTIVDITGNTVSVSLGGGCQGCSAAAMTVKEGIEQSFRKVAPTMGALLDATDHSAGTNPFFS